VESSLLRHIVFSRQTPVDIVSTVVRWYRTLQYDTVQLANAL